MSNNPVWERREMGGGYPHHQSSPALIFPDGLMKWIPPSWKLFGIAITEVLVRQRTQIRPH